MKRTLATLLAVLTLLCAMALPMNVSAKTTTVHTPEYFSVGVRRNEAKTLYLEWEPRDYEYFDELTPTGYQIYRSDSGKSGTYQKIATTKKSTYQDKDLKNGTVYYYRVRGYVKRGDTTYYSKFVKAVASTKLTNKQATNLLQKAYQAAGKWMDLAQPNCNRKKYLKKSKTEKYGDETYTYNDYYYLVTDKNIRTKKQLKAYLGKIFDQSQVNRFVNKWYLEENGKLWMLGCDWGDGAGPFADRDQVIYVSQNQVDMSFVNICYWGNDEDLFCDPVIHTAELRNGRWILTDEYWFRYTHFINLE